MLDNFVFKMRCIYNFEKHFKFDLYQRSSISNAPLPDPQKQKCDFIGLPDKVSNLRPLLLYKKENETPREKLLRESRIEVHKWNQEFWFKHNQRFFQERNEFIQKNPSKENISTLTADEMSVFYKSFLDTNWKTHLDYNVQWYKRNIKLLILSFQVLSEKILKFK
ncbi:APOPT family protein CG14806, mitochondrial [Ctenocephalides felis]|uniref:APOPT family protein CG14806, mitochondrial n=1 Tax=Ctenocephalides felis TaxID=7515 RepID=UPI000E6E4238|nr:APOPT family protein CG14806, mitochondrial [Ctenocephalides felis]